MPDLTDAPIEETFDLVFEQVNASFQITVEADQAGQLVRFKNAILARAELNKNNDDISAENINELAATLSGRAVDIGHDEKKNAGFITASRAVVHKGKPAVAIDGVLWPDRYPDEVDGVMSGSQHLSVEAEADRARCLVCNGTYASVDMYCEHLKSRRRTGSKRGFVGMRGTGAGITPRPAGTETRFDRSQIYVVAHQEADPDADLGEKDAGVIEKPNPDQAGTVIAESEEEIVMEKCPHCAVDVEASEKCPKCGKSMSATLLVADLRTTESALATAQAEAQVKAAELTKALADIEVLRVESQQATSKVAEITAAFAIEKKTLEDKALAAETGLATTQTALTEAKAELEVVATKQAEEKKGEREALLKPMLSAEVWEARKEKFFGMDDDTFATMAASMVDAAQKPALGIGLRSGLPDKPVAGADANKNGKHAISLRD